MNRSILERLPLGFRVFRDAARLIWRSRILRTLAAAEIAATLAWYAMLVMFLQGVSQRRLVALGSAVPLPVHIVVMVFGILFGFFGIPWIGAIAWAIRSRTVAHTRWLLGDSEQQPPTRNVLEWAFVIAEEGVHMYRRLFLMGFAVATFAGITAALVPGPASPLQTFVQATVVLTLMALNIMLNSEHRAASRIKFIRARWPDIAGYVVGSWLFTLWGFMPFVINLLAVAEELFHRRVNVYPAWPDEEQFRRESGRPAPPRPQAQTRAPAPSSPVHPDIENYTRRFSDSNEYKVSWDARLPAGMRFVYYPLYGARPGDTIAGVLLLVGADGRGDPNAATEFWLTRSEYTGHDFWTGKPPFNGDQLMRSGDVFAGPFPLPVPTRRS